MTKPTDIYNYKSKEFYINLDKKDIPPKGSIDYPDFVRWEKQKCREGVTIGGIYIPGTYYFKLNHLEMDMDAGRDGSTNREKFIPMDSDWILHNAMYRANLAEPKEKVMVLGCRQLGKFLADYEPVITIDGEKPIGEIQVGDKVFGKDGKVTNVTAVHPQGVKPIYRMTLDDKRFVDCGLEHLWEVVVNNKTKVLTTEEIINQGLKFPCGTYRFRIPETKPVEFEEKELSIDPYILGFLIGDGGLCNGTINFSTIDPEIEIEFKRYLGEDYEITYDIDEFKRLGYNCKHYIKYVGKDKYIVNKYGHNPFTTKIRDLGLNVNSYNKFIPEIYKYGSVQQRIDLLAGITDSDGYISPDGHIEIKFVNEKLAQDVLYVARSLGIRGEIATKLTKWKNNNGSGESLVSRVHLRTALPIFRLPRKLNRVKKRTRKNDVAITKIEYLTDCSATCISVDNQDHLYLTKDFVPTHNSLDQGVFLLHSLQFYKNSNALLLVDEKTAVSNVTRYLDVFMLTMTPDIKVPLLDKDFDKTEVRFGVKGHDNTDIVWNTLFIRNVQGGIKTEVSAGTTIRTACIDEVGRFKWSAAYTALEPAMKGSFGLRNAPLLSGTGGQFLKGKDAQEHFLKPNMMNLQRYAQVDGVETGLFLGNGYRRDAKEKVNLLDYLKTSTDETFNLNVIGKLSKKPSELDDLNILVKNKDKAEEIYTRELSGYLEENMIEDALKYQMYYPKEYTDIFLSKSGNRFYREGLENHKKWLENEYTPQYVDLYKDNTGEIKFKLSDKVPITTFPTPPDSLFKDCPVVIYDHPRYKDKYRAYKTEVSGLDGYFNDDTATSDSLGSIYVVRRTNSNIEDEFHETMVASFTSRPKTLNEFNRTIELILEYYGCTVLHESNSTFIQYFDTRKKGHYLEDVVQLQREISPKTKAMNTKGMAANSATKRFRYDLVEAYLDEETKDGLPGYTRIKDPMLIAELLAYNPENKKFNGDRIDGFSYALVHLFKERKYSPIAMLYEQELEPKKIDFSRNFFGESKSFNTFDMKRNVI